MDRVVYSYAGVKGGKEHPLVMTQQRWTLDLAAIHMVNAMCYGRSFYNVVTIVSHLRILYFLSQVVSLFFLHPWGYEYI